MQISKNEDVELIPKVSVIMCTRNRHYCIMEAIDSLLAESQEDLSYEIIIVDDNDEGNRLRDQHYYGRLLRVASVRIMVNTRPSNISRARNMGLLVARGEWICFLDDDDLHIPGRLEKQWKLARATGAPVVLGGMHYELFLRNAKRQMNKKLFVGIKEQIFETKPTSGVLFFRYSPALKFDESLGSAEDLDFYLRLLNFYKPKEVPNITEAVVIIRPLRAGDRGRSNINTEATRFAFRRIYKTHVRKMLPREDRRLWLAAYRLGAFKFEPYSWVNLKGMLSASKAYLILTRGKAWRQVLNVFVSNIPFLRKFCIH